MSICFHAIRVPVARPTGYAVMYQFVKKYLCPRWGALRSRIGPRTIVVTPVSATLSWLTIGSICAGANIGRYHIKRWIPETVGDCAVVFAADVGAIAGNRQRRISLAPVLETLAQLGERRPRP